MRARGGHLNWHAKHANMVTGGHKEGKKRGHNMLYTRVTSTKSLPPGRHPTKNLRDQKTQDKTPKKSDVNSTTDNEWLRQTSLKKSTFSQKLLLSKSSRAKGCRPPPKRMNFQKNYKRPLTPPPLNSKFCDENHEHHHQECDLCSIASFGTCWWSFMTRAA